MEVKKCYTCTHKPVCVRYKDMAACALKYAEKHAISLLDDFTNLLADRCELFKKQGDLNAV